MYEIGLPEMAALCRVVARKQLMRYRGGENGYTDRFEALLCEKAGARYTLAVNSGTSALICAMVGLELGPGDEIIVPAYTWVATALAPLAVGAVPILADIDESLTIDPADVERKITPYTRAIIPVHMSNLVCDMDAIMEIAKRHNLAVVEDASQAVGAWYKGRRVGTIGDAGVFSFNQFKNISAGEGGALLTNDERIFRRATMYHDVGSATRQHMVGINEPFFAGMNFRVSELTGAILYEQLKRLDRIEARLKARRKVMAEELSQAHSFSIAPHHDAENALGISLLFETSEAAKAFCARTPRSNAPMESGRHIYTNWSTVMNKTSFHSKINPYDWAQREIIYTPEMCIRTLEILARTCHLDTPYRVPVPLLRRRMRDLVVQAM